MKGNTKPIVHKIRPVWILVATVVDLDPNVKTPIRTHLKTAPKIHSDDIIIKQARNLFANNLIKIYQIKNLLMPVKVG